MVKTAPKLVVLISLLFIGINAFWLLHPQAPLQAKTIADDQTISIDGPLTRPATAPVDITVDDIVATGFNFPIQVTHAGDGTNRLFVVEKSGQIKIISNGTVLATPFLNISSLIVTGGFNSEQGLLGLAFHPDYTTNRKFYLNYTRLSDGATVIAQYTASAADPNVANAGNPQILMTIPQPDTNHNGGQIFFGPDGYLYIGMGDGGGGNDVNNLAQNLEKLLGKMLRIDVDNNSPNLPDCDSGGNYRIPANPFVDGSGNTCDEIWAIGLRNPWRFSFDRLTGDMFIGDVGQASWEEISYQPANMSGLNFGWRVCEGFYLRGSKSNLCNTAGLTDPIAAYERPNAPRAVSGGFIYRGSTYPALQGRYFYADYVTGEIWSIEQTGNTWTTPDLELDKNFAISAFGEDEGGELYVVEYNSSPNGKVRRLQDANGATPNLSTSQKSASTPHADPGETVTYTVRIHNSNGPSSHTIILADQVPAGLTYVPNSLTATPGNQGAIDASSAPTLKWQGTLSPSETVTITYAVSVDNGSSGSLINEANLSGGGITPIKLPNAIFVPRPVVNSAPSDFFFPGTQPNQLTTSIPDPQSCNFCHTDPIYDRWRGSMMSQSGRDPLFWAALTVANNDAPNSGEFCLRCHTPKGWLEGRSQPDGGALQSLDLEAGIACEVCHRMVDPVPSASDEAVSIDAAIRASLTPSTTLPANHVGSAMMIVDPADNRRGPFSVNPPHGALQTDFLGQSANAMAESRLCGTCHNIDNPLLSWDNARNQFWPNDSNKAAPSFNNGDLFPIERTFDEWANSEYASTGVLARQFAGAKSDGIVRSCQDCHMRRSIGFGAEPVQGGLNRDCSAGVGCLPEHDLVGGNTWVPQLLQDTRWRLHSPGDVVHLNETINRARQMLQNSTSMTITLQTNGPNKIATVRVYNEAGHKFPTGYVEGRRVWLNLKAYDQAGSMIYESGVYDTNTGVLTSDAALKIYEAKQGITPELAAVISKPAGESFHFVLNNTVIKDNRIPPRGYTQAGFDKPGLRPIGATYADGQYWDDTQYTLPANTERAVATLYYQTSSKEYIDFLRTNGGVDGNTLGTLWDTSKSPPEVIGVADSDGVNIYFPVIYKN